SAMTRNALRSGASRRSMSIVRCNTGAWATVFTAGVHCCDRRPVATVARAAMSIAWVMVNSLLLARDRHNASVDAYMGIDEKGQATQDFREILIGKRRGDTVSGQIGRGDVDNEIVLSFEPRDRVAERDIVEVDDALRPVEGGGHRGRVHDARATVAIEGSDISRPQARGADADHTIPNDDLEVRVFRVDADREARAQSASITACGVDGKWVRGVVGDLEVPFALEVDIPSRDLERRGGTEDNTCAVD